jgi:hypothetical protein
MQKKNGMLWTLLLVFALVIMAGGCGGSGGSGNNETPVNPDPVNPNPPGETLTVTPTTLNLTVGQTGTLTAANFTGSLVWESEDTSVATVQGSGAAATVTAVAVGETNIVVEDDDELAECRVVVTAGSGPGPDEPTVSPFNGTWRFEGGSGYIQNSSTTTYTLTMVPKGEEVTISVEQKTDGSGQYEIFLSGDGVSYAGGSIHGSFIYDYTVAEMPFSSTFTMPGLPIAEQVSENKYTFEVSSSVGNLVHTYELTGASTFKHTLEDTRFSGEGSGYYELNFTRVQ